MSGGGNAPLTPRPSPPAKLSKGGGGGPPPPPRGRRSRSRRLRFVCACAARSAGAGSAPPALSWGRRRGWRFSSAWEHRGAGVARAYASPAGTREGRRGYCVRVLSFTLVWSHLGQAGDHITKCVCVCSCGRERVRISVAAECACSCAAVEFAVPRVCGAPALPVLQGRQPRGCSSVWPAARPQSCRVPVTLAAVEQAARGKPRSSGSSRRLLCGRVQQVGWAGGWCRRRRLRGVCVAGGFGGAKEEGRGATQPRVGTGRATESERAGARVCLGTSVGPDPPTVPPSLGTWIGSLASLVLCGV